MRIESIISSRLHKTGKVHISGWGTFYLKREAVRWNHITNTIFPAGQYLHFSPNPGSKKDTLLPEVMKSLGASMEVSEQWIGRKIKGWQNEIDNGNVLMLAGLGSFPSGKIFNAEPGTFGAESFGFVPIMIHKLEEQSALQSKVVASLKIPVEDTKNALKAWQRAGAAAAVAALFSLGVMQSSVAHQVAGWFSQTEEINTSNNQEVEIENTLEESVIISNPIRVESTTVAEDKTIPSKGYSIVVGSFKEKNNANNYAADLAAKGMEVSIIPGSLRKVSIGHYTSRAEALEAMTTIKTSVNSGAWIYAY
jgi:cell division septation protein DedD